MGLWVGAWYRHTYKRRLLDAYSWQLEIWQFLIIVKNEATVDAHGDVNSATVLLASLQARLYGYLHTCVGFCVARSSMMGTCQSL